jgi:hypothetical protein
MVKSSIVILQYWLTGLPIILGFLPLGLEFVSMLDNKQFLSLLVTINFIFNSLSLSIYVVFGFIVFAIHELFASNVF